MKILQFIFIYLSIGVVVTRAMRKMDEKEYTEWLCNWDLESEVAGSVFIWPIELAYIIWVGLKIVLDHLINM